MLYHTQCCVAEDALKGKNITSVAQVLYGKGVTKPVGMNIWHAGALAKTD